MRTLLVKNVIFYRKITCEVANVTQEFTGEREMYL